MKINKTKIFNDPIYGFITIPSPLIFDLIEHPYFQRLRRISQMGLSYLVYPGAHHTRFHHALGAMHLMQQAIEVITSKGTPISVEEQEALLIVILLHDVGHGPFSHALESTIIEGVSHETLTLMIMQQLNTIFEGKLSLAIQIFTGDYHRQFMLQLVSSQLDMDRLDYLNRDSFYSGVAEGKINSDRLIKMLNVVEDCLVLEEKSIYSVEKFLMARRLMYWQVYLHKTSLAAELMLLKLIERFKLISPNLEAEGTNIFLNLIRQQPEQNISIDTLNSFLQLDDFDVIQTIKQAQNHPDNVIAKLSHAILNRKLFRIKLADTNFTKEVLQAKRLLLMSQFGFNNNEAKQMVFKGKIKSQTYNKTFEPINILFKDGSIQTLQEASGSFNHKFFNQPVTKFYFCYPKDLDS